MKTANVAEFKSHLGKYVNCLENGEEIQLCKRNVPFARLMPLRKTKGNCTQLGCGKGTVAVKTDLTLPVFESDWDMLKGDL